MRFQSINIPRKAVRDNYQGRPLRYPKIAIYQFVFEIFVIKWEARKPFCFFKDERMESTVDRMTDSFCNQLTGELVRLAQRLKSRNITGQIDAIDIVQMAWKSAWMTQHSGLYNWERKRIRGYLKSIMLNKLKDCLLYTSPSPRDS